MSDGFDLAADAASLEALAPGGVLRAAINLGNPVLARSHGAGGEPFGLSVDMAKALAGELGVQLELVKVEAAALAVASVAESRADLGFFAIDPQRATQIRFTEAYIQIEGGYVVRDDASIRTMDQVDRPGVRVVVGKGSAYDLHLGRRLQQASIVRAAGPARVLPDFLAGGYEVAAGIKPQLAKVVADNSKLRLLDGHFMLIPQALGVAATRPAAATELLARFVKQAKRSGFIAAALARHGVHGVSVAA